MLPMLCRWILLVAVAAGGQPADAKIEKLNHEICLQAKAEWSEIIRSDPGRPGSRFTWDDFKAVDARFNRCRGEWLQGEFFSLMKGFGDQRPVPTKGKIDGVSILDLSDVHAIYSELRINPFYPYEVIESQSCFKRADAMSVYLKARGVSPGQITAERGDFNVRGSLSGKNVHWDTHTALYVWVRDGKKIALIVIDPSLSDVPLTDREWLDKITESSATKSARVKAHPHLVNLSAAELRNYIHPKESAGTMISDFALLLEHARPLPWRITPEVIEAMRPLVEYYTGKSVDRLLAK